MFNPRHPLLIYVQYVTKTIAALEPAPLSDKGTAVKARTNRINGHGT